MLLRIHHPHLLFLNLSGGQPIRVQRVKLPSLPLQIIIFIAPQSGSHMKMDIKQGDHNLTDLTP